MGVTEERKERSPIEVSSLSGDNSVEQPLFCADLDVAVRCRLRELEAVLGSEHEKLKEKSGRGLA